MTRPSLVRRSLAESAGTAFLLAAVVGSGIMGERLAGGNTAIALLANSLATGGALLAIILTIGPISGAHLNPVVSILESWAAQTPRAEVVAYCCAQAIGAVSGVVLANLMFGEPAIRVSQHARAGAPLMLSEFVATVGLLGIVTVSARFRPNDTPIAVAAYITSAYWFTASTSFANPAVTLARTLTNTFAGISPASVPAFLAAQVAALVCVAIAHRMVLRTV